MSFCQCHFETETARSLANSAIPLVYAFALSLGAVESQFPRSHHQVSTSTFSQRKAARACGSEVDCFPEDSNMFCCTTRFTRPLAASLFVFIALALTASSAIAQSDSNPKMDLFAGYQYLHPGGTVPFPGSTPSTATPFTFPDMAKGIGAALTYNFDSHWGLEGDFGYNRNTDQIVSEWTASGGPRFIVRTETAAFFIHALAGFNRVTYDAGTITHNGIGGIFGGGMDLPFTKTFSWRVFQVDYVVGRHNFADIAGPGTPDLQRPTFSGVRLRTGIVVNWGGAEPVAPTAACTVQPTEVM